MLFQALGHIRILTDSVREDFKSHNTARMLNFVLVIATIGVSNARLTEELAFSLFIHTPEDELKIHPS